MKIWFTLSILLILVNSLITAQSDIVGSPTNSNDVVINNISCPPGTNNLSFELTIIDNMSNSNELVSPSNSISITLQNESAATVFSQSNINYTPPLENLPIHGTLSTPFTCDNIVGLNMTYSDNQGNTATISNFLGNDLGGPPTADPIPTLGEWALIILALLFINVSLISIKQHQRILDL